MIPLPRIRVKALSALYVFRSRQRAARASAPARAKRRERGAIDRLSATCSSSAFVWLLQSRSCGPHLMGYVSVPTIHSDRSWANDLANARQSAACRSLSLTSAAIDEVTTSAMRLTKLVFLEHRYSMLIFVNVSETMVADCNYGNGLAGLQPDPALDAVDPCMPADSDMQDISNASEVRYEQSY